MLEYAWASGFAYGSKVSLLNYDLLGILRFTNLKCCSCFMNKFVGVAAKFLSF